MQGIEFGEEWPVCNRDKFRIANSTLFGIDIPEIDSISLILYMCPGIPDAVMMIMISG
jgi:hypothetical protein